MNKRVSLFVSRILIRSLSLMGYFIVSIPYANLYILARGPDRNLDTFLDQADESLGWVVNDLGSSTPPWEQLSFVALLILFVWWSIESYIYIRNYKDKMPFTAFVLNAKMNLAFIGYLVLAIVTLPLAITQGSEDGLMFPAASLGMIGFALIVFILEFLIVRTVERLFGDRFENQKFKFRHNFLWSRSISSVWNSKPVQRVWDFLG